MLNITNLNQYYGGSHTLLKCIMGLLPLATGELIFKGADIRPLPVYDMFPVLKKMSHRRGGTTRHMTSHLTDRNAYVRTNSAAPGGGDTG
jgi:ABC-type cobalamin/Fe3+-siderophores transport system ATPase subunit